MNAFLVVVSAVAISVVTTAAQTLPDSARQHFGSASAVLDLDAPVTRQPELMTIADLVIHGRISNVRTRLNDDESLVVTEYTIEPIQAFKQRQVLSSRRPGLISSIVVQRPGGRMRTEDGLQLSTSVNAYPERECFVAGEEVVVFLTYQSDLGVYKFSGGEFGAYRIKNGIVSPMTRGVAERRHDNPVEARIFFQTLRGPR